MSCDASDAAKFRLRSVFLAQPEPLRFDEELYTEPGITKFLHIDDVGIPTTPLGILYYLYEVTEVENSRMVLRRFVLMKVYDHCAKWPRGQASLSIETICSPANGFNPNDVRKNIREWARCGGTYRLMVDNWGGCTGHCACILFKLPRSVGASAWENYLPRGGDVFNQAMDRLRFAYLTACAPLCLVSALIEKAVGELVERCFLAPLRWVEVQPINSQLELRLSENTDLAGMIRRSPPNKGSSHVLSRRFPEGNWTYALNLPATRVFLVKAAFKGEFIISIRIDGTTYADSQSYTYPHQMPDTVCTERNAVFWELPMRFAVTNLRLEDFEAMYMTRQGQEGFWRHYLTLWIKYATGEQIKEAGTLLKEEWLR